MTKKKTPAKKKAPKRAAVKPRKGPKHICGEGFDVGKHHHKK